MPPRKPLSSRAPLSRRDGASSDRTSVQPTPSRPGEEDAPYRTGSDYPVAGGEGDPDADDAALGDEEFAPPTARYREGEDIYGEDDPYPEEDDAPPRSLTRGAPQVAEVTRIGVGTEDSGVDRDDDGDDREDDENATRAGPPIHVEVISGPDQGRKKRFRGVRMVIGRAEGCDFRLADASVSRRHLELVLGDDGVMLRDLGSGNGTRVNDEKLAEHRLEDGDEIAIGKTRFRFVDELAALRKKNAKGAEADAAEDADGGASSGKGEGDGEGEAAAAADAERAGTDAGQGAGGAEADDESTGVNDVAGGRRGAGQLTEPEPTHAGIPRPRGQKGRPARGGGLASNKRILIAAGAAAALLIVLLVAASSGGDAPAQPVEDPRAGEVALQLQKARTALAQGRFDEAVTLLEAAEKTLPGADTSGLLEGARKEAAAQRGLDEVRALFAAGEFDRARVLLAQVPLAVVVSETARTKVQRELEEAELADRARRLDAALTEGNLKLASELLETLPRTEQGRFFARLEALRAQVAAAEAEEAKRLQNAAYAQRKAQASARQAEIDAALESVRRRFDGGDWRRAALECDRVIDRNRRDKELRDRALQLKRLIPQFGSALADAQKKLRSGNREGAAAPLRRARDLYRQIGFDGPMAADIDEQLAKASMAAAKSSMARNDLASAAKHYRQALSLTPSDQQAKSGLSQLQRRAEDVYLEGYIVRDRDPRTAADKFRLVMDILPADHPTRVKAQTQLAALEP